MWHPLMDRVCRLPVAGADGLGGFDGGRVTNIESGRRVLGLAYGTVGHMRLE